MTTKFYTAKSSANRALKKAVAGYEAFVTEQSVEQDEQGFYGHIVLKPASGRHLQEFLQEKGMDVVFDVVPTKEEFWDQLDEDQRALEEAFANLDQAKAEELLEAGEDEDEVDPEIVQDYLNGQFALMFMNAGGNDKRGRCKALRAVAAAWEGSRKEFIAAAVANGIKPGTANANYQAGYK